MNTISRQGYHLVPWLDSEFNYWAVSDVNEKELREFQQLFEQQFCVSLMAIRNFAAGQLACFIKSTP
jgi:hypothetical protein